MSLQGGAGFMANGTIQPCRFVKYDTTAGEAFNGRVLQCSGTSDIAIGVSQEGTRNVPYSSLDDGNAALQGENIKLYQPGDLALLLIGAGGVVRGNRIATDATGQGIIAGTAVSSYAIALETRNAGDKCWVRVTAQDSPGAT